VCLGVVDQVELAGRLALGGEQRRRLGSVLRAVIHDVHQHLPDRHPFMDVSDEAVGHGGQPCIDDCPLGLPAFAHLVDRRQRLELGFGLLTRALESVAPALRGAEVVDQDAAETSLVDDVRPCPHGRIQAVEDVQQLSGRSAVLGEQEANLICLHQESTL
jgi:hypothetical protein